MALGGGVPNPKATADFLESGGYHHRESSHDHRNRDCMFKGAVKIVLLFVMVTLLCLVLNQSTIYPSQLFQGSYLFPTPKNESIFPSSNYDDHTIMQENDTSSDPFHQFISGNSRSPANDENNLENVLKKASMKDKKTVIITTLNAAWAEPNSIFDIFLESFRIGNQTKSLLNNVVVAAFDQKAYSRCIVEHLHCYAVTTKGVDFSSEAHFMSKDYLKMMWRRIDFLRSVLELGYNFVFTDADVMWLRDPFERFFPDGDFQIACDHYWYNYTDLENSPNGGFTYVKANNKTIQFYKFWYKRKDLFPGKHDQDVLNMIKFDPYIKEIELEMRFLDTAYFGGFCEPSKDLDLVVTMHANCCIGMKNKIHDMKMVIDDWKNYKGLNFSQRNLSSRTWTVPRICG